ncbi:MAG: (2Fe-2S) ferredoxin domain-containing protein [Firmicutes bacterium]|nr:(2Fe-2S) ferredoxin domain-containing protein [Bacillota bacterium]
MKSLEDLKKLKDQAVKNRNMFYQSGGIRIQIGMGTCGIAAGARPVLIGFEKEIRLRGLKNIIITQVGCMGECAFEPIVEIVENNGNSTTYCLVNERMISEIVEEHLMGGKKLDRYLLSSVKR